MSNGWEGYEGEPGARRAADYETVDAQVLHSWLADLLPDRPAAVLDVETGPGRDAAWLASEGHDVVAVEPSTTMLAQAQTCHTDPRVLWVQDSLPSLAAVHRLGVSFDLILLSAVWMHVRPADRPRAFRKLANLLSPGGVLAVTLRHGHSPLTARCIRRPVGLVEHERPVWRMAA